MFARFSARSARRQKRISEVTAHGGDYFADFHQKMSLIKIIKPNSNSQRTHMGSIIGQISYNFDIYLFINLKTS